MSDVLVLRAKERQHCQDQGGPYQKFLLEKKKSIFNHEPLPSTLLQSKTTFPRIKLRCRGLQTFVSLLKGSLLICLEWSAKGTELLCGGVGWFLKGRDSPNTNWWVVENL